MTANYHTRVALSNHYSRLTRPATALARRIAADPLTAVLALAAASVVAVAAHRRIEHAAMKRPTTVAISHGVDSATADRAGRSQWYLAMQGAHRFGPERAPVSVVFFSDYYCSACHPIVIALDSIQRRWPDHIAVVHRHIPATADARALALAAACMPSAAAFRNLQLAGFEQASARDQTRGWPALASRIGITDAAGIAACIASDSAAAVVNQDVDIARQFGVVQAPAIFVNGRPLETRDPVAIVTALGLELARHPDLRARGLWESLGVK